MPHNSALISKSAPCKNAARFIPGQSGNPGGRPKEATEVKDLARSFSDEAAKRLVQLMRCRDPRVSLSACTTILDRAWGKPFQQKEGMADRDIQVVVNFGTKPDEAQKAITSGLASSNCTSKLFKEGSPTSGSRDTHPN